MSPADRIRAALNYITDDVDLQTELAERELQADALAALGELLTERDQLRAALTEISTRDTSHYHDAAGWSCVAALQDDARAALAAVAVSETGNGQEQSLEGFARVEASETSGTQRRET